ncbi:MAG: hypothetical protein PHD39_03135 [Methylobacter tundripaludum]|nr:hypothetical protein [Methylobacter tundripaludum]
MKIDFLGSAHFAGLLRKTLGGLIVMMFLLISGCATLGHEFPIG